MCKYLSLCALVLLFTVSLSAQTAVQPPDFSARGMDDAVIDTAKLRGKVVVLNLWFVNCPNCIEEIALLNDLVDQYAENKEVVFLAPAASTKAVLQKFLVKNPFKYQVIPDAVSIILGKFGTPGKNGEMGMPFPMHLVMDREGKVVVRAQGLKGIDVVKSELSRRIPAKAAAQVK